MQAAAITLLVLWAAFAAGCNTIDGIGRDIEAAGKGIQRSTR
jgi:predicted small secreted protein